MSQQEFTAALGKIWEGTPEQEKQQALTDISQIARLPLEILIYD
ncbi:MAG: hypothetical protein AAGF83_14240 [Cyanobacteria bacterium P01_G01_bin.67]